ncbi:MAG: ethanolamine permease [Leptospiraceae bacterium]|nr:ethanolamine permease [Leptospiraceae bacterium]
MVITHLNKTLKPIHLWAISVGLVISGDYFGWNYGYAVASKYSFFGAILFVSLFYICFAFSFTELTSAIPNAGGPFAYSRKALGRIGGFIAGFAGLVEFLLAPPAIASAFGAYVNFLFPEIPALNAAVFSIILFTIINLFGIKQTANIELVVTIIASLGLVLYLALLSPNVSIEKILSGTEKFHFGELFAAIPFAIWFYLAVEGVALAAEETIDPKKNIPIGYGLGMGTLVLFACLIVLFTSSLGIEDTLSKIDYPLPQALSFSQNGKSVLVKIFSYLGLFGIMASLMGIIFGYSRQIFALARSGYLPGILAILSKKYQSPYLACIAGSVVGIIALLVGKTDILISFSVLGAIVLYIISMISLFRLRIIEPELERPYLTPFYPITPIVALISGIICLIAVAFYNPQVFLAFGSIFLIGILIFYFFGRKDV